MRVEDGRDGEGGESRSCEVIFYNANILVLCTHRRDDLLIALHG